MISPSPDPVTAYLAEVRKREEAATPGPWWSDQDELMYRLHGVAGRMPAALDGLIPEQVVNKQIAKAPKSGTPYAEYWPDHWDDAFITSARSDVPRLLAAVETALALHAPGPVQVLGRLCAAHANHRYFSITATEAADVAACPKCSASISVPCSGCGTNGSVDRCPTRQAISAALLGEDVGNDRAST